MNYIPTLASVAFLMAAVPTPAVAAVQAPTSVTLRPAGPWNLHYENQSCKLRRSFGIGAERISIEMTKFGLGENFELILFGQPLRAIYQGSDYTVSFGDLPPLPSTGAVSAFDMNKVDVSILHLGGFGPVDAKAIKAAQDENRPPPPSITDEQLRAIRSIAITVGKAHRYVLESGSLEAAVAGWDKCIDELVRSWGVDPTLELANFPVPKSNPGRWLTARDYPAKALQENKSGFVYFRLLIDESGAVTDCAVQRAVNEGEFAAVTCALLRKRAKFSPAKTLSGQPVPSYFSNLVRFRVFGL